MTVRAGARLGPYEIEAPLGAGGMGEVWRARDVRLERAVAVKVLPEGLSADREALARFEREAKACTALFVQDVVPETDTTPTRRRLATIGPDLAAHSFAIAPDARFAIVAVRQTTANLLEIDGLPPEVSPRGVRR